MTILLSNDDGFQADGIRILDSVLSEAGHRIAVAAPDSEQSGKSHGFTITGRIRAVEYAPDRYHFSGTPADCIIYSHRCSLFPFIPDAVIAGINHGYNLSGDIIYSGTCAAARQAAMYGIKSIAVSVEPGASSSVFRSAAEFVRDKLDIFLPAIPRYAFMNINIPSSFWGGWELSSLGFTVYSDEVAIEEDNGNEKMLRIVGCDVTRESSRSFYPVDADICRSGMASVSIVRCLPAIDEDSMDCLFF